MKLVPRDYQNAGDTALWNFVHTQHGKNPLMIMPTGVGKSLQMAMFIWHTLSVYPSTRIMMATHVKELVQGNYKTLLRLWPSAPAGVYSAGLGERNLCAQVTFAGIASVVKRAASFGKIDFLLVDEAHRISDNGSAMYRRFIDDLKLRNPHLVVIGFTATGFREGTGLLTDGELFDEVAFDLSDGEAFVWMIENGYLIKPIPKHPGFQLDSSQISIIAGDFDNKAASDAMAEQDILERAVDTTIALGEEQGRQAWLTFCQSIEDAELVADMFRYKGHAVEPVHSKRDDRDDVLKAFADGKLRGVTNKDILTTGFDLPKVDLISMLRLTRSTGLWVQMLGRGTRPLFVPGYDINTKEGRLASIQASSKQSCLVLDFCGNTERLGPINYPRIPKRRNATGDGDAPVRLCPQCNSYNHISKKFCEECGYEFPPPERVKTEAGDGELVLDLSSIVQPPPKLFEVYPVHRMVVSHNHGRSGKMDTMRVDYFSEARRFSTWVCLEHTVKSFPRVKAEQWWKQHKGAGTAPTDVATGVDHGSELHKPKFIKVWINTKFPEIVDYDFRGTRFELPPEFGGPPLVNPESEKAPEYIPYTGGYFEDDIPF